MHFQWDETKRTANVAKHGLDFADLGAFDWEAAVVSPDLRRDYSESRFIAIGRYEGRMHVVIFAVRSEAYRIISFRRANDREVRRNEEKI